MRNFTNKFWIGIVIVALLFQSASPALSVVAKSNIVVQGNEPNIVDGMTLGSEITPENRVPDLPVPDFAKQVADQAKTQPSAMIPLHLKVSAVPAIYIPGKPLRLQWSLNGLADAALGAKHPQLSIQVPVGVTPSDPTVKAGMNAQGLLNVSESSLATGQIEWLVGATAKFPLTFSFSLQRDGQVLDEKGILVDIGKFNLPASGGSINANHGWVKVNVPAGALTQPIALDVRDPSPQQMPSVSLTGYPIEIVAAGKTDGKDVKHFNQPISIQMQYDPVSLVYPNSQDTLTMYYYDQEAFDWIPLPTSVDTIHRVHAKVVREIEPPVR